MKQHEIFHAVVELFNGEKVTVSISNAPRIIETTIHLIPGLEILMELYGSDRDIVILYLDNLRVVKSPKWRSAVKSTL